MIHLRTLGSIGLRLSALALVVWTAGTAQAADDPAAKGRLDALIAAYRALPAYVDHGAVEVEVKMAGQVQTRNMPTPLSVARPNKLIVKTPLVEVVSDGKTLTTFVPALGKYMKSAAPAKLVHNDLTEGPLGSHERGGPLGMPLRLLLTLLLDDDPASALARDSTGFSIEKDQPLNGVTYSLLRVESDVAPPLRIWIDPKTKLASRIDVLVAERASADSEVPGVDIALGAIRWTVGEVSTTAPPADAFAFKPPTGSKEVVGLDASETAKSEHELVGKPSPDFTLNVLEASGKSRRMTLHEFEGKVVLIDFWAMWCAPCRKEMPDIAKLSTALAKAKKPIAVVALSIDQPEESDLKALEKKVRASVKTLGFDPENAGAGVLAIDPSGTVSRAFGVQAIPMLILIDGKGVVRAVHVGLTELDVLEAEIDALVAGKPIPKPSAK